MTPRGISQSGNVFFIIFLAIAMFAALSYVVFQSSRVDSASLSSDQARLTAQEIISFGDTAAKAAQTLKLRDCSEDEMDFENGGVSRSASGSAYDYVNAAAPQDGSCHVMDLRGGKVVPSLLTNGYVTASSGMDPRSFAVLAARMKGAGSDATDASGTDVILQVGRLKPEVCKKINDILGVPNPSGAPPVDTFACGSSYFKGSFGSCGDALGDTSELSGKTEFCSGTDASGLTYSYYKLLLAR